MQKKSLQRFAFAFVLILLLQEFSSARYVSRPLRIKEKIEERKKRAEENNGTQLQSRTKRNLAAVLLGFAIFVSLSNIAFDVYLKIKGCCGLFPDACTYKDLFRNTESYIQKTQKETDAIWVKAEKKYNWVLNSNAKNVEIWTEVKRIMELSKNVVEVLNPNVIQALIDKNKEIKGYVQSGNKTVLTWTSKQVSDAYTSLFDTQLGTLQHLSGIIGNVAEILLAQVYGWYKKAQIRNMLRTSYGSQLKNANSKALRVLANADVDGLVKQTARARYNYQVATTRGHRIMSIASGVMSVVQVGFEIFIAILKVKQCREVRDKIKSSYEEIFPQKAKITKVNKQVKEYHKNLTNLYSNVHSQVTSDEFLSYLGQIKTMTDDIGYINASKAITAFTNGIRSANEPTTFSLQSALAPALTDVEFVYDCLLRKAKAFKNSVKECKKGSDPLPKIYNSVVSDLGTNNGECTTKAKLKYTKFSDVDSYVKGAATREGFQYDCILNNKDKLNTTCNHKCNQYTVAQTAQLMSLREDQVTYLYSQCSPECPITPAKVATICYLKGLNLDAKTIAGAVKETEARVQHVMDTKCP